MTELEKFQRVNSCETTEALAQTIRAFADPETQRYLKLTAAEADGVTDKPVAAKAVEAPKQSVFDEPEEAEVAEVAEPVKRAAKKAPVEAPAEDKDLASLIDEWED